MRRILKRSAEWTCGGASARCGYVPDSWPIVYIDSNFKNHLYDKKNSLYRSSKEGFTIWISQRDSWGGWLPCTITCF